MWPVAIPVCLHAPTRGDHDESFGLSSNHVKATVEKMSSVSCAQKHLTTLNIFHLIYFRLRGPSTGWELPASARGPRRQQPPPGGHEWLCGGGAAHPPYTAGLRGRERLLRRHGSTTVLGGDVLRYEKFDLNMWNVKCRVVLVVSVCFQGHKKGSFRLKPFTSTTTLDRSCKRTRYHTIQTSIISNMKVL